MSATPRKTVGSRELKTRLGTYLRQVEGGMAFVVTDRGRAIAELRPLEPMADDLQDRLQELVNLGVLSGEVREPRPLSFFEPLSYKGPLVSEALLEDREDRF